MKPPSGGPVTGPSSAGRLTYDIARTSSERGTVLSSTSRPTGTIIAPPIPCTMRDRTRSGRVCDRPQPIEPSMKTTIAALNTRRAPKRSAVQPLIGTNTARLRR